MPLDLEGAKRKGDERAKWQEKANQTGKEVWWRGDRFVPQDAEGNPIALPVEAVNSAPGKLQYKVITQRDEFFQSKFNPEALQSLLNQHAAEGWHVVAMTTTDVGSFFGAFWSKGGGASRQELVILLERAAT
jgi:hypothetical protein